MKKRLALALIAAFVLSHLLFAQSQISRRDEPDWKRAGDEAVELLANFLRIDTTNPPGNEQRAGDFFARILEKEGIEHKVFQTAPGRAVLYARLRGSGRKRALILLNHTDVVPADKQFWTPIHSSGAIRNGYLFGRGALDMVAAAEFMALIAAEARGRSS